MAFVLGPHGAHIVGAAPGGSASGGSSTPTAITVADEATDTTCFLAFFTAATGDLGPKTNANLAFNSSTGLVTLGGALTVGGTLTLAAGVSLTGAAGAGGLALGSMTGATALPTGNLSWAGASGKTVSLVSSGGAITITADAASTWKTSTGALTVDSAAALNVGTTDATSVVVGNATNTTAISLTVKSNGTIGGASDGQLLANVGGVGTGIAHTFGSNLIHNDGGDYFQEHGAASASCADGGYCADGFYVLTQTANVNVSRTTGNRAVNAIRLTQNQASAQRMGIAQVIENALTQPYRSRTVAASFAVNISNSQAVRYALLEWTSTANSPTKDVVKDWTSSTYTANNFFLTSNLTVTAVGVTTPSAATWTTINITGTLSSSANNLYLFVWTEGTAAQNVTLDVSELVLCDGAVSPTWIPRPPSAGLHFCRRYYRKTFDLDTAPGDNVATAGAIRGSQERAASTSGGALMWDFGVAMRTTPTVTLYNVTSGTAGQMTNAVTSTAWSSCAALNTTSTSTQFTGTTPAGTAVGQGALVHAVADARL